MNENVHPVGGYLFGEGQLSGYVGCNAFVLTIDWRVQHRAIAGNGTHLEVKEEIDFDLKILPFNSYLQYIS